MTQEQRRIIALDPFTLDRAGLNRQADVMLEVTRNMLSASERVLDSGDATLRALDPFTQAGD